MKRKCFLRLNEGKSINSTCFYRTRSVIVTMENEINTYNAESRMASTALLVAQQCVSLFEILASEMASLSAARPQVTSPVVLVYSVFLSKHPGETWGQQDKR